MTSPHALTLDLVAQRYRQRPSRLVGIPPEAVAEALDFDVAIMTRALLDEARRRDAARRSDPEAVHLDAERLGAEWCR